MMVYTLQQQKLLLLDVYAERYGAYNADSKGCRYGADKYTIYRANFNSEQTGRAVSSIHYGHGQLRSTTTTMLIFYTIIHPIHQFKSLLSISDDLRAVYEYVSQSNKNLINIIKAESVFFSDNIGIGCIY